MNRTEAEEHLRVIRSLMEKATIYRAISAPTALVGGLASMIVGGLLHARLRSVPDGIELDPRGSWFLGSWGTVLLLTALANTWFLWRDAKRRGDSFISSGMRHALLAMMPAMLCGGGLSLLLVSCDAWALLPPIWMLCYALALLATKGFAPRSIEWLGWMFFAAGFAALICLMPPHWLSDLGCDLRGHRMEVVVNLSMLATFGLFHLIYAAFAWPRGATKADAN